MILRRRTAVVAAVVVAMAGALSACTGDDPGPAPEPTVAPTPAPDPEPEPTAEPVEREDPEDFIRRWREVSTEMQNTGITTSFRLLWDDCDSCEGLASSVEEFYEQGGYIKTDGVSLSDFEYVGRVGRVREYRYLVEATPTEYKKSRDAEIEHLEGGQFTGFVRIRPANDTWKILDYGTYVP
ncbi:hypothetical protein [Nocardioides limicola]|uniref:hypothetical protein n=1 Tax=Nocardioides limicola TaxID=2803368 RepID=UPI00193B471F|nr:hypothetical protein [Nocardioides sp. DJM-14]